MKVEGGDVQSLPTRPPTLNSESFRERRSQLARSFVALFVAFVISPQGARAEQPLAASTVVVYNKAAADSAELARFYAKQRGIASDHIVGLNCSTDEEITREEYDTNIAGPLRETFQAHNWWKLRQTAEQQNVVDATTIRFVALIKGVPLKIKPVATPYDGDKRGGGPVRDHTEA